MICNIKTMADIIQMLELSEKYIFRGQRDATEPLSSTFERATTGLDAAKWHKLEKKIMLEFRRRAHHYLSCLPTDDAHVEWLALMQHHGAPTRLLDFTRSFYVALYFAIEEAKGDAAVWAIDTSYISPQPPIFARAVESFYSQEQEEKVNQLIADENTEKVEPAVVPVEPMRQNERLSIQQGLFLFPTILTISFEQNLCGSLKVKDFAELHEHKTKKHVVFKLVIAKELHLKIAYWLTSMNITAATLFPGLDGFARSQVIHAKLAKYDEKVMGELLREAFKHDHKAKIKTAMDGMNP